MKTSIRNIFTRLTAKVPHAIGAIALVGALSISGNCQAQDLTGDNLNLTENGGAIIDANGPNTTGLNLFVNGAAKMFIESGEIRVFERLFLQQDGPEIRMVPTGEPGFEIEAFNHFEISQDGTGNGFFKILKTARLDGLTIAENGIVVGGEVGSEELTVIGNGSTSTLELQSGTDNASSRVVTDGTLNTLNFETRSDSAAAFNQVFRSSLDAQTDSITIQPTGMVSLGVPFSSPDPFGLAIAPIKLRVPGSMFFDRKDPTDSAWVAGTNGDFFAVSDALTGPLPFRIERSAPTDSLHITSDGNIGSGTSLPDASLHVVRNDGTAAIKVEETGGTGGTALREMLRLENNGGVAMSLSNTDSGDEWEFTNNNVGNFQVNLQGTGGPELRVSKAGGMLVGPGGFKALDLRPNGNLFIAGSLTEMSDRNSKENYENIDCDEILDRLCDLSVTTWNYKTDEEDVRHIGPVAQEFHKAFGLGHNNTTISTSDKVGVNMAAIKALKNVVDAKEELIKGQQGKIEDQQEKIEDQQQELEELRDRMDRFEAALLGQKD